jgi:hypothetical protein
VSKRNRDTDRAGRTAVRPLTQPLSPATRSLHA